LSTPKSQRHESNMQYIQTARDLRIAIIKFVKSNVPKSYTLIFSHDVVQLANDVHNNVKMANSVYPTNQHEFQIRRDYLMEDEMPYKISRDGIIIDALNSINPYKWINRSRLYLPCKIEEGECISCDRTGQLYHPEGWRDPKNSMDTVTIEEISNTEYSEITKMLEVKALSMDKLLTIIEEQKSDIDFALALLGADVEEEGADD